MYGLTRGSLTLASVAVTGLLFWAAGGFDAATTGGYWAAEAVFVLAGLVLALAQVAGRWTRAGRPRFSPAVFVLGFLPALIAGTWLVAAAAPHHGWLQRHVHGWSADIGVLGGVDRLAHYGPPCALVVGLVLGFSFDGTAHSRLDETPAPTSEGTTPETSEASVEDEHGSAAQEDETAGMA